MLAPSVFKAYDVRGIVPDELDAEGAYAIACGYVAAFEPKVMAVGRDMRLSSPEIAAAAIRGAADSGADVVDLGQIGTEMLYFAVGEYGYEGGLQITASHNPAAYNGMKIVRRGALPVGGDTGLDKIKARALGPAPVPAGSPGEISKRDVYAEFHDRALGFIDVDAVKPLNVVSTARTGSGPMVAPTLERLPVTVHPYSLEPDGHFPNHEPNPLLEENRQFIMGKVKEHGADLGIAWDGDADRCFFIDDTGEFVPGDLITALHRRSDAASTRARRSSTTCGRRGRCATRSPRRAGPRSRAASGTPSSRPGSARRTPSSPARSRGTTTSAISTTATRASCLRSSCSSSCRVAGKPLSALLAPFRERYHISGEINSTVDDVPVKLQQLKERYSSQAVRVSHMDGISFEFEDWHFNVRPSNTEPLLRLNLEALDGPTMERRLAEVLDLIRG